MTVTTFDPKQYDPTQPGIRVTDAALAYLRKQMQRVGASALRLSVNESGCSGYMYELDYVAAPGVDDLVSRVAPDLALHVAADALALLRGTEIDCVKEGLNTVLKFKNPNAESECGCGESFSVSAQSDRKPG
jgi:iron-sulfur cluster assembly accessory protein